MGAAMRDHSAENGRGNTRANPMSREKLTGLGRCQRRWVGMNVVLLHELKQKFELNDNNGAIVWPMSSHATTSF